jgi:hypothetical protein
MAEYLVHVKYDQSNSSEREQVLREIEERFGIDPSETMASELSVTLDERGYKSWLITMIAMDDSFISAPHYWNEGQYFVAPVTNDQYLVTAVL